MVTAYYFQPAPAGVMGPEGPAGPTGPTGPAGPAGSGSGGAATQPALGPLLTAFTTRASAPRRIAFTGSSTTFGSNASTPENRYVNRLIAAMQAAYPSGTGSESTVVASDTATWGTLTLTAGIHGYNAGQGGTTSATYLTSGEMANIAALEPVAVFHMVGSNDFSTSMPIATYKANVTAAIAAIKAAMTTPCVHILVHPYQRWDTIGSIPWADYGAALSEIAEADPDHVAFFDLSGFYETIGIPSADPFDLIDTDSIHQRDNGHAFMAELLRRALDIPAGGGGGSTGPVDTTAPTVPADLAAVAGDTMVTVSWSESLDAVGVTGYRLYRGGALYAFPVATTFIDGGLTNGTTYSYRVSAIDAAGNESAQATAVTATPAASGTTLAADTFTRAAGALGTAPTGQTWLTPIGAWAISSNQAVPSATGVALIDVGTANFDLTAQLTHMGGTSGLAFRAAADGVTRLQVVMGAGSATLTLFTGPGVSLATGALPTATVVGQVYTFRVVANGSTITIYVDGAQRISHTLSSGNQTIYNSLTHAGFRQTTAGNYTRFDNLLVKGV